MKVLHVAGPAQRSRLRREALALAAVRHAAVVQVHDYGEAGGEPYIVMELLQGEPLAARLGRAGAMSAPEAAALLLPLLDGLTAAHRAGVVHRDIKPENVILAEGGAPKLVDFGIARLDRASRPRHRRHRGHARVHGARAGARPPRRRARRRVGSGGAALRADGRRDALDRFAPTLPAEAITPPLPADEAPPLWTP